MYVHRGNRSLDGAKEIAIEKTVQIPRQAALNADFSCAELPRFAGLSHDVFRRKRIGIGGSRSARETAEAATHKTHIREIDIAVDDVSYRVADGFAPQRIRHNNERIERRALRGCKEQPLLEAQLRTAVRCFKAIAHFAGTRRKSRVHARERCIPFASFLDPRRIFRHVHGNLSYQRRPKVAAPSSSRQIEGSRSVSDYPTTQPSKS